MKSKAIPILLIALPLALASCSKKEAAAGPGSDPAPASCIVSDEELGSMGKPVEYTYEGKTLQFCCKSCIPKFEKEPEKFLAKLGK